MIESKRKIALDMSIPNSRIQAQNNRKHIDALNARYRDLQASPNYNPNAAKKTPLRHAFLSAVKQRRADSTKNRKKYAKYLASQAWQAKKIEVIAKRGRHCELCSTYTAKKIDVHHLSYQRVGHELDSDLQVLCDACHCMQHGM